MILQLINLIVSWTLVGLIWVIQLVHYPTFRFVAEPTFKAFHQHHSTSITIIVMPLMLMELGLSTYLAYDQAWKIAYLLPFLMVVLIWASTFFIQIPLHQSLGEGSDMAAIQKLVQSNWIRTILWTIKSLWLSYFFWKVIS